MLGTNENKFTTHIIGASPITSDLGTAGGGSQGLLSDSVECQGTGGQRGQDGGMNGGVGSGIRGGVSLGRGKSGGIGRASERALPTNWEDRLVEVRW